ncbi:hypothetical protein [Rheinheimera sp. SA_1]|uniref:hypothetical protein n=1 Tax=Rheinheimera sp. SA_1 TaxID=1827365 RepID=UPI000B1B5DE2|nr:hypothetical protein [Rheinheimera sp. SA_1]
MNKFSDQNKAPTGKRKDNSHDDQDDSSKAQKKLAVVAADKSADKASKTQTPVATTAMKAADRPDALKSKWKSKVNAAKSNWGKLSSSELLKSEGDAKNLAELVHLRYSISLGDANKQVKQFLDKCNC